MSAERLLDLDRDLPVTAADVEAQRRLRADLPSWFELTWTQIADIVGTGALDRRPLAEDHWRPLSLETAGQQAPSSS